MKRRGNTETDETSSITHRSRFRGAVRPTEPFGANGKGLVQHPLREPLAVERIGLGFVALAQFDRVDAKLVGELIHRRFESEHANRFARRPQPTVRKEIQFRMLNPVDCRDLSVVILDGQREARHDANTVDQNRARSTGPLIAPLLGAGQPKMFSERIKETVLWLHDECLLRSVDVELKLTHQQITGAELGDTDGSTVRVSATAEIELAAGNTRGIRNDGSCDAHACIFRAQQF